jgi:hypothetical protein
MLHEKSGVEASASSVASEAPGPVGEGDELPRGPVDSRRPGGRGPGNIPCVTSSAGDVLATHGPVRTGVPDDKAIVRFGETPKKEGTWAGSRVLLLDDAAAFTLSHWCGTCPFLFQREDGANRTLSLDQIQDRLAEGLHGIDLDVVAAFGDLLGEDDYVPVLLRIRPTLVEPSDPNDYFSREQVATWGRNSFWGLPENPRTPYYRTYQTAVSSTTHLYEFVVPMVPPSWNDDARVENYLSQLSRGWTPTAVAASTLDVCQPAMAASRDYYAHWGLTHFLLDGHRRSRGALAGSTISSRSSSRR